MGDGMKYSELRRLNAVMPAPANNPEVRKVALFGGHGGGGKTRRAFGVDLSRSPDTAAVSLAGRAGQIILDEMAHPLAEEMVTVLADYPGWSWLLKYDGAQSAFAVTLHSPCYNPVRGTGQIYLGFADSPAAALRKCRMDCDAFNASEGRA